MKDKISIHIYLNNFIAIVLLFFYKMILSKPQKGRSLLLINTGQIGDLIISSLLLNNVKELMVKFDTIYFLAKKEYISIVGEYENVEVISWEYSKFKFNPFYRFCFLNKIRSLGISACVNLTAARGITADTLALLSGAHEIIAFNNNYRYLKRLFGYYIDKMYSEIIDENIVNEFEKHLEILKHFNINKFDENTALPLNEQIVLDIKKKYNAELLSKTKFVIAPFTDSSIKDWGIDNYSKLIKIALQNIDDLTIFLFGSSEQKKRIENFIPDKSGRVISMAGELTILESAAFLSQCDLFIGNDSGFTHVAKALNIPLIGIIGGGANGYFLPYNVQMNESYLFHKMDCFGCEWRCIHEVPFCLTEVKAERVLSEILRLCDEDS